ncbi:hypothetical protein GEV41_04815 [Pseudomonas putida]|nr:hypothetical protein GEV41_04815 [Pseudomonas putida]
MLGFDPRLSGPLCGPSLALVGAGLPAKGPGLLANFHQSFTVAATTVFAGKPAPTHDRWWTYIGD